jgi:Mlc titration factor MtfA (ptsG expression regulator)
MRWFGALKRWRRARIVRRLRLDEAAWQSALQRHAFTRVLDEDERARLRESVVLFLHDKAIHGARGIAVTDEMRLAIAIQACMLVLGLDLDYYRGWVEIVVYPDEFVARYDYVDEDGVAHAVAEPMSGESWVGGPVILSWADAEAPGESAYNVVIHEFAHKLDMLNGDANGFPPLHRDMSREAWSAAFSSAYEHFCERVERDETLPMDPYAAESPAEFFAVATEVFFEAPFELKHAYPAVYQQLAAFFRQDTAVRALRRAS